MPSEMEFVNYKEFVESLPETESPDSADKSVISNPTDGPRSMPGSASALTEAATEADLVAGNDIEILVNGKRKKLPAGNVAKRSVQDRLCENDVAIDGKVGYKSVAFVLDYDSSDIYKTDGTHAAYESWHSTDFIDCTGFSSLDVRGCDANIGSVVISVISFFDENHDIVSYANVSGGVTSIVNTHIEVPDNASYFRAVYQDQKIQNPYVRGWLKSGSAFADKSVEPIVSYLKNVVGVDEELAKSTDYTSNTIYNINGGTGSYESWKSTDFINCIGFEKILVKGVEYKVGALTLPVISFFDSDKQFMVGYHTSGGNNQVVNGKEYAVPSGASFFRAITCTNDINDPFARGLISGLVDLEVETQPLKDIINLKIACVGDSLTEGDYGSEPEGTMNIGADTYPTYLHRQLGSDVKNYGKCGYSASMYWSSKVQTIAWSTEKPQVVVIMLGVNGGLTDTLDVDVEPYDNYTDYANTNTGCYCKIIEYINEQLAGKSQIILCKTPYVDSNRRPVYAERAAQANLVIPKIAARYNLPVIDTTELGLSFLNTHVLQPIDGLHFGKFGYSRLGTFIGSQIKKLLSFDFG